MMEENIMEDNFKMKTWKKLLFKNLMKPEIMVFAGLRDRYLELGKKVFFSARF